MAPNVSHRLLIGHGTQIRVDVATGLGQRVAAELLQRGTRQYQRHHRLDHHAGSGHRAHVGALVDRHRFLAGGHVDGGQRARHGRDRLHRRADPQRLAVGHAAFQAAGAVGGAHDAVRSGVHLVVGQAAAAARGLEAVADLDALDGLDAHHRGGELAVEAVVTAGERPEPDGQSVHDHLDDTAERVAVLLGGLDLGDHRRLRLRVKRAHRAVVDRGQVGGLRRRPGVGLRRPDRDDVRHHLDAERLPQELPSDGGGGDPGRGLAGAGALEHRPGVVEAVLEHSGVVGVAGPRAGQRRVAGARHPDRSAATGSGAITVSHFGHSVLPISMAIGPPSVCPVPHSGEHGHLVLLEFHPRAAAVAQAASAQLFGDVIGGDGDAGDHAFDHGHQRTAVGFTGSGPSQHVSHLPTRRFGD